MEWDLLEKTTFWVDGVDLAQVNLADVAGAAAAALSLRPGEVMVVDVRPGQVAFDVLRNPVRAQDIAGREKELLRRLGNVPGVTVSALAAVHSEGVLGYIALDEKDAAGVLAESARLAAGVSAAVKVRAVVFASGAEVMAGKIEDTNSPYIMRALREAGFKARFGGVLEDRAVPAAAAIEAALGRGYGLVVTTGGVGAEDKDFGIEAVRRMDPGACTPWILKFTPDYHRHHKEGVRIAVGEVGLTRLVALPGPHEEAKLGCDRLIEGLKRGLAKDDLAEFIAGALRRRWREAFASRDGAVG